uniref:Uncharacterized protein n=1 Tax=Tetraselmis chuii TaxID=63592 RepID=A0A7S1SXW4_9CHLO
MDSMLQLKREREQQRRATEQAVIGSLKTMLMSLEAAELDVKTRSLTEAQEGAVKAALGDLDRLMDKKERETMASMSLEMEKHVSRVVEIQQAPKEQKEAMIKELTESIMADTHPPAPKQP